MVRHLRRHVRGERGAGAALPLALGFLVFFGVLMGVIFGFASSSLLSSDSLERERNGVYDAESAVNAAIAYARKNADVGKSGATDCGMPTALVLNSVNGVTVNCVADVDSGEPLPSTSEPGSAILTLAQFTHYWSQNTLPPSCSTISTDPNAELGIMQFQHSKLLKVTGNVYVNSDVDSDVWSGGCPQVFDAKAINVEGKVKVRESCHDIFALQGFTWNCDQNGQTDQKTQADAAAAGRNPATPNGGQPANDPTLADPAIADPVSWAPMITTPPAVAAVPACGTTSVVAFTPGTYNDAAALSALTNGTCGNKVLWFQPGVYYFDFANTGSHEWSINDGTTRVIGGKPNGVATNPTTIGPTTWTPTTATSPSNNFTPAANGLAIDGTVATATINSSSARTITIGGFNTVPPSALPGNVIINSVQLRVVHAEPATVGARTVTITPSGGSPCSAVTVPQRTTLTNDTIDVTGCLNTASKLSGGTGASAVYSTTCATCTSGSTAAAQFDGMALEVTYTVPGRPAWDGTPASVDASSPSIPGSCRKDGDSGWGETDGVQWVFGGDSHINLTAGRMELCNMRSSTHQEIVVYGVRSAAGGGTAVGPVTLAAANPPAPTQSNWTTTNVLSINGSFSGTGNFNTQNQTRWVSLGGYAMPAAGQIPANATGLSTQLRIAHFESGSSSQTQNLQVQVRNAADTSTLCTVNVARSTSQADVTLNVPGGCLSAAALNSGSFRLRFQIQHTSSGTSNIAANLDGMELKVSYTVPASGGGGLTPASGCVTQRPYYNRTDHVPGFNGASALIRVAGSTPTGSPQCDTTHVCATFWGTVYAPSAALDIQPDVLPVSVFGRGVVARMLTLGYNIQSDALVPISVAPVSTGGVRNREMVFTAKVVGTTTDKLVAHVCIADVEACVDGTRSVPGGQTPPAVLIRSWKVTR